MYKSLEAPQRYPNCILEYDVAKGGFSLNPAEHELSVCAVWKVMKAPWRYPSTEYAFASQACIAVADFETVAPLITNSPFVAHVNSPAAAPVGPVPEEFERDCIVEGRYSRGKFSRPPCVLITSKTLFHIRKPEPFADWINPVEIGNCVFESIVYTSCENKFIV